MQRGTGGAAFALSFSSLSTYAECPRRFALRYLADRLPAPERWTVRLQGRLAPWSTATGKLVDETLAAALRQYRGERTWPEDLYGLAMRYASEWWRTSRQMLARQAAGHSVWSMTPWQPLDRHYYGEPVASSEVQQVRERVRLALGNWWSSPLPEWITASDPGTWRGPREPGAAAEPFRIGETRVRAAPDFAFERNGEVWILDWKCGVPSIGAGLRARDQLMIYALLARHTWEIPAERLRLLTVWLLPEYAVDTYQVGDDELDQLAQQLQQRQWELLERLWLPHEPADLLGHWPVTPHLPLCRTCPFRGSCPGAARLRDLPRAA